MRAGDPDPLSLQNGQLVEGRYRLEAPLGAGGTSEVWRGVDERLGRRVAVKVLKPELSIGSIPARVEQEARAAAQLRHPAIVEIYDVGKLESGLPFIVMEYLVGLTVASLIEQRIRLEPADAVSMLLPIVDGLAAAHDAGVVHRDVKPDNIFVCRLDRGILQPKIVDFGVARVTGPSDRRLTVVGTVVGTPVYMAPEQALGDGVPGPAVDVWAVGVTLYEALTGRIPFEGQTLQGLFASILTAPLPYPRDVEDFDSALFSILADATRKIAEQRPSSAELVRKLAGWLIERGVNADLSGRALASYGLQNPT